MQAALIVVLVAAALTGCNPSMLNPFDSDGPLDVPYPDPVDGVMTLHVAPGGDDDAKGTKGDPIGSIQGALSRVTVNWRDHDLTYRLEELRILVQEGRYTPGRGLVPENVGFAVRLAHQGTVFGEPKIVIEGGYSADWTAPDYDERAADGPVAAPEELYSVLDGQGKLLHIAIIERPNVELRGFVLTGGNANDEPLGVQEDPPALFPAETLWRRGAGLYVIARGSTVEELYITSNSAVESSSNGALVVWPDGGSASGSYRIYLDNGSTSGTAQTAQIIYGDTVLPASYDNGSLIVETVSY